MKNILVWWAQVLTLVVVEIGCVSRVSLSSGCELCLLVQRLVLRGSLTSVACWKLLGSHPMLSFCVFDTGRKVCLCRRRLHTGASWGSSDWGRSWQGSDLPMCGGTAHWHLLLWLSFTSHVFISLPDCCMDRASSTVFVNFKQCLTLDSWFSLCGRCILKEREDGCLLPSSLL